NWRVRSASPAPDKPGREKRSPKPACFPDSRIDSSASGARPRSRSSVLAWRSVSASMTPCFSRPPVSSALYSKPDMPGVRYLRLTRDSFPTHAQDFLERGLAGAHPAQAVVAQALHATLTRVIAQVGFRGAIVDQAPRLV